MTDFLTKITCELNEIKDLLRDPENDGEGARQLENVIKNVGHYKRAKEAIAVGKLHSKETIALSRKEAAAIYGAESLRFEVITENLK